MMESQQWPSKYHQSVGFNLERTDDSLNNGNCSEIPFQKTESIDDAGKNDPENGISNVQDSQLGNNIANFNISGKSKTTIENILELIKDLSQPEKFLLYLKLPTGNTNCIDPLKQPLNPLGNRCEINKTICWIRTHLEEDPDTSLPKQEVYNEYSGFCSQKKIKPLSQADFGKVMKQVYPKVRARRLGVRGHSKYCYAGLKRCLQLENPSLPDLSEKLLSTETPCTQANLTAAACFIVQTWCEQQLGIQFANLQALAIYFVIKHSICVGTDEAKQLTSHSEADIKADLTGKGKSENKHRELQLQLQRKIQVNKDRKRKNQSPKTESKCNNKKARSHSVVQNQNSTETSPTFIEGNNSTSTSSSTSPTQGKPICDKTVDFTLTALPDFNSFQKPSQGSERANKVAIPRLSSGLHNKASHPPLKNTKYKAIQPKLCDNKSYNPQQSAEPPRSQILPSVDRFKERKSSDEDCDVPVLPFPRERLDSISNVDKDAMDEYLGSNNSQHEEEVARYFRNNNVTEPTDNQTSKLSQLRQLLEQNGIADKKLHQQIIQQNSTDSILSNELLSMSRQNSITIAPPSITLPNITSSTARRRVSFETPLQDETVPPSPNTRRKNFSFTPISPGPQSPSGRQSKCSSTNASPFVSPRNTPIPRTKNNMHQNAGIMLQSAPLISQIAKKHISETKIKREPELSLDLPIDKELNQLTNYPVKSFPATMSAVSAPASPMLHKSVLQSLLNANNKVAYTPDYTKSHLPAETNELNSLFNAGPPVQPNVNYRSHSVPLSQMVQMKTTPYPLDGEYLFSNQQTDFNDLDPIPETQNDVNDIINSLDQQCDNSIAVFNNEISPADLNDYGIIMENSVQNDFPSEIVYERPLPESNPAVRNIVRSQSIDMCANLEKCTPPSRSVPSTPLPFTQNIKPRPVKIYQSQNNSRSYPSTPVITQDTFNYNLNRDCLLNGQPIRNDGLEQNIENFISCNDWNGNNGSLQQDKNFSLESHALTGEDFTMMQNENSLIDSNCLLISDQNFNGNIN